MKQGSENPSTIGAAPPASLVPMSLLFYGVLLAIAAAWSAWSGDALLYAQSTGEVGGWGDLAADIGVGFIAALAVIWLSAEFVERTFWGAELADGLAEVIGKPTVGECIILAVASGLAEEALFRGALQPQVGLLAASLIFGLAHIAPRREFWPWSLFAAGTGLLMGILFEWTGNLIAPATAHMLINAVNLRRLAVRERSMSD